MTRTARGLNQIALLAWLVCAVVISLRVLLKPDHLPAVFTCYRLAGIQWMHAAPLYLEPWGGFVYTPVIAAFFSPFGLFPEILANLVWRLFSIASLAWGVNLILTKGPFRVVPRKFHALVFLGILPSAAGNLDRGQANPVMLALLLLAIAAAGMDQWILSAVALAIATYFKVYPLAIGLLLCVVWPKKVTLRLAVALLVFGLLPFALQNPGYVFHEYQSWIQTRLLDNRLQYPITTAPLDLWYLFVRIGRFPISPQVYWALRAVCGLAIALFCLIVRSTWRKERVLAGIYILSTLWIILLGPATESATYLLLAPVAIIGLIQAFVFPNDNLARSLAAGGFALLLAGVIRDHFFPHTHNYLLFAASPISAIFILIHSISWLGNAAMWPPAFEKQPR